MKQITIICANDSMELAFLPGTNEQIIEQEKRRIKKEINKRYKPNNIYVHLHTVELYNDPTV